MPNLSGCAIRDLQGGGKAAGTATKHRQSRPCADAPPMEERAEGTTRPSCAHPARADDHTPSPGMLVIALGMDI